MFFFSEGTRLISLNCCLHKKTLFCLHSPMTILLGTPCSWWSCSLATRKIACPSPGFHHCVKKSLAFVKGFHFINLSSLTGCLCGQHLPFFPVLGFTILCLDIISFLKFYRRNFNLYKLDKWCFSSILENFQPSFLSKSYRLYSHYCLFWDKFNLHGTLP